MSSSSSSSSDAAAGPGAGSNLYLQELSLHDCSCSRAEWIPRWSRLGVATRSGKRKQHPPKRGGHTAVCIPASSSTGGHAQVVLFGGSDREAHTFADGWRFDCGSSEWSPLPSAVGESVPPARSGHTALFVPRRNSIIVYGGQQQQLIRSGGGMEMRQNFLRDVWALNCATWQWSKLPDHGDAPQRNGHTAILIEEEGDSNNASMIVFGGSDASGPSHALYRYELSSNRWTLLTPRFHSSHDQPPPRELHASCAVSTMKEVFMVVSGGRGRENLINVAHALRIPLEEATVVSDNRRVRWDAIEWMNVGLCPPRAAHTMVNLAGSESSRTLPLFTQQQPATQATSSSVSSESPAAAPSSSSQLTSSPNSTPAASASSSSYPLLLFGGTDGIMFYNDVLSFSFDPSTVLAASSASSASPPPPGPCPRCQGPPGWIQLQKEDKSAAAGSEQQSTEDDAEAEADADEDDAADDEEDTKPNATASSSTGAHAAVSSSSSKKSKRKKKKRARGAIIDVQQPPTCFAHTMTTLPYASPAFVESTPTSKDDTAASSSTSSSAPISHASIPCCFLLFGGMNDEFDIDATHILSVVPNQP